MKHFITIIVISLSLLECLSSQGRISLYLEGSPNYCFGINLSSEKFKPTTGYSASLKVGYQLFDHLQVISGMELNNKGYEINVDALIWDHLDSPISTNPTIEVPSEYRLGSTFIEVPVLFKYSFVLSKFLLSPNFGFSYGRLLNDYSPKIYRLNAINILIGLESAYIASNKLYVKVEPHISYSLTNAYKSADESIANAKLYLIGLKVGIIIIL